MVVESVNFHLNQITNPITILHINIATRDTQKEIRKISIYYFRIAGHVLRFTTILLTGDFLCFIFELKRPIIRKCFVKK